QNQQLQEYNERLKRFIQVVSHDLKQPLRTIQSFVGLLDKRYASHLPEGAQEYMGFIRKNTSQMYELIEGLLSLSELEKQGGPTNHQWIDSRTTAENALHQLQQLILDKDADIRFQPTDHWPKVNGHQAQLTQLWQNLIGNALKFSPKGEVVVTLGCEKRQGQVTFFVRDNGIGISPEDQPRIFQMFSRLHNRRDYEGHGIGLATCKRIVDLHGGRIWVESLVWEGSTFYFSLDPNRIGTPSSTSSLELA
ncbi:MAG: hypothetical protein KDC54_19710, partial [Lewinella sp.]|nr:hypothetical protein [Lewinella sp.]